jgi:hypothetical protein
MAKNMQVETVVETEMLVPLGSDEQASLSVSVSDRMVHTTHTVKPNKESQKRYNLNWSFDFYGLSQDEILKLAEKSVRIMKQAEWRKDSDQLNAGKWDHAVFKVSDILAGGRKTTDPVKKAESAIGKLSPEELEEFLKKYVKG